MSEPYPIQRWSEEGVSFETVQGDRGAVPHNDRLLLMGNHPLSFDEYLLALDAGLWAPELVAVVRDFFYRNEAAIFPQPRYQGPRMLQHAETLLEQEGLEAAQHYVKRTKGIASRSRGRTGACERCHRRRLLGRTPGSDDWVCWGCHALAQRA